MARPSNKRPDTGLRLDQLRRIWAELSVEDWLALLSEYQPESGLRLQGGQLVGRCFFHEGDKHPSMWITPSKGILKCFGAGCGKVVLDPISLVASAARIRPGEALLLLKRRFGLRGILPERAVSAFEEYATQKESKRVLVRALNRALDHAMTHPELEENAYALAACDWLRNVRKVSDVAGLPIGILPPALTLTEMMENEEPEHIDFARKYLGAVYEGYTWIGSVVFHTNDDPDSVCRLKVRRPATKDFQWIDDPYDAAEGGFRGFYGLECYGALLGSREASAARRVILVEGEFDALTPAICQQAGDVQMIVLAMGGKGAQVTHEATKRLRSLGVEQVWIAPDNDKGGVDFARVCLQQVTSEADLSTQVMSWPAWSMGESAPKDFDAWIVERGWQEMSRWVTDARNYLRPHQWAVEQVEPILARINREDPKQRHQACLEWARVLRNSVECREFCDNIAANWSLSSVLLFRDARARDEDEVAFVERLQEALLRRLCPIGYDNTESGKTRLELWDKEARAVRSTVLPDPRLVDVLLAQTYGGTLKFIDEEVGAPQFMETGDKPMPLRVRNETYRDYAAQALLGTVQGLPDLRTAFRRRQGYHYMSTDKGEVLSYLVNGRRIWRLRASEGVFTAQELDTPKDGQYLFRLDEEPWLTSLERTADFERVIAPEDIYGRLFSCIRAGWSFKNQQDVTAQFLAGYVMALPIMSLFPRQTAVMLCAESTSGKSKFVSGLVGGTNFQSIHVVACAKAISNYTAPGIRQMRDGSSNPVVLEEFEDNGSHEQKALRVRAVLDLLRDLISEGHSETTIGSSSGKPITYRLRFPFLIAGIRPLRDEASLSRFVVIEMKTNAQHEDPCVVVQERLGPGGVERLRADLGIGMFRYAPRLIAHYAAVQEMADKDEVLGKLGSTRIREALYPVMAVLRLCGQDPIRFAREFLEHRKAEHARIKASGECEQITETILDAPFMIPGDRSRERGSVRQLLLQGPAGIAKLNAARIGVYVNVEHRWMIIVWTAVLQELLRFTRYGRESSMAYLKTVCDRGGWAVTPERVEGFGLFRKMAPILGPGMRPESCSVLEVGQLLPATVTTEPVATTAAALTSAQFGEPDLEAPPIDLLDGNLNP